MIHRDDWLVHNTNLLTLYTLNNIIGVRGGVRMGRSGEEALLRMMNMIAMVISCVCAPIPRSRIVIEPILPFHRLLLAARWSALLTCLLFFPMPGIAYLFAIGKFYITKHCTLRFDCSVDLSCKFCLSLLYVKWGTWVFESTLICLFVYGAFMMRISPSAAVCTAFFTTLHRWIAYLFLLPVTYVL